VLLKQTLSETPARPRDLKQFVYETMAN
jgi:hypothetical protein